MRKRSNRITAALIVCALASIGAGSGCTSTCGVDATATAPVDFGSRLESEMAHYLVAHYWAGEIVDEALHAQIDAVTRPFETRLPTADELRRLSTEYSVDLATLVFVDAVRRQTQSASLQERFERALQLEGAELIEPVSDSVSDLTLVFVPGWMYRSHPETGADFAAQRQMLTDLGVDNLLLETEENGSVEDNAVQVAEWIRAGRFQGRRLVLISASKSGPEVALALSELLGPDELDPVAAWINIGGVLAGSPLADEAIDDWVTGVQLFFGGMDPAGLASLTTARRAPLFDSLEIPSHILVVNYVPVPLAADISERAKDGYETLRPFGPNDGLTLLAHQVVPGSATVMELGLDHYLLHPDINHRGLALFHAVLGQLAARGQSLAQRE